MRRAWPGACAYVRSEAPERTAASRTSALDVLPAHYSAHSRSGGAGSSSTVDVVLAQLAADGRVISANADDRLSWPTPFHAPVSSSPRSTIRHLVTLGDTSVAARRHRSRVAVSYPLAGVEAVRARTGRAGHRRACRAADRRSARRSRSGSARCPTPFWSASPRKKELGLHSGTIGDGVAEPRRGGCHHQSPQAHGHGPHRHRRPAGYATTVSMGAQEPAAAPALAALYARLPGAQPDPQSVRHQRGAGGRSDRPDECRGRRIARTSALVGGHADFMRGCLRSPGGRGIVAMESTARGGTVRAS